MSTDSEDRPGTIHGTPVSEGSKRLEWPVDRQVYLTLDFECDYGTALSRNAYDAVTHIDKLISFLEERDVALTVFVQTEVLEKRPETVEAIVESDVAVRFHPHSHTHRARTPSDPSSDRTETSAEIETSTDRYREFFGRDPVGYRFPNGNVFRRDYRLLADAGYDFDASVFPSWRPGRFDNTDEPTVPRYMPEEDIVEIPFTVFGERLRVPTALSYCNLLGRPLSDLLLSRPPRAVVFNVHMHDLVTPPAYDDLSPFYRALYARCTGGFSPLDRALAAFAEKGYSFSVLDHVHDVLRDTQ